MTPFSAPIHTPATLREVATQIKVPEKRLISIMHSQWEEYIQPHNRLHDGYIHRIFEVIFGWECVPNLIKQRMENEASPAKSKKQTQENSYSNIRKNKFF